MRLIDADAFKSYIDCGHLRSPNELCFSEIDVVRMIDKQPTANAEPVRHGRWIKENIREKSYLRLCSACSKTAYFCGTGCSYKYCPNCGAKMDGKGNAAPVNLEPSHRPEECVYYATRQRDGRAVCMGTRELDPCDGAGCKRWKPKKDGGLANG